MLDELAVRRQKLERLVELGRDPFATETARDTAVARALASFDDWSGEKKTITLAGRMLAIRVHGGMMFADLQDESGKIQLAFKEDAIGADEFAAFRDLVDPGDFVEARGTLFATKRGEKSLNVGAWKMLAKALRPLPEKFHGLQDVELRERHRELDLIANAEVKRAFLVRSKLIAALRRFLDAQGFVEVETPILQPLAGGANARPFITHHNALDMDLFLRIAPELYLKRLLVGGFEKIFEIGRCFRNEGIDYSHNPEFTMLELYWAYAGKERFLAFLEAMIAAVLREAAGSLSVAHPNGALDFTPPFPRLTFRDAVKSACGIDIDKQRDPASLLKAVAKAKVDVDFGKCVGIGECYDELYKKTARPAIVQPTWVMDYPVEMIPLAGRSPEDPTKSATAQLVANGAEIVKGFYHELHDSTDQRARLKEQQTLREQGSEEAQPVDEAFLQALEQGMPPASGMGLGIDRFASLVTGSHHLKEVILFPTLRPRAENKK